MNEIRREQIVRALAHISETIDILGRVRAEEEKALETLSESLRESVPQIEDALVHLEEAIDDLVNVEDWLESAKA